MSMKTLKWVLGGVIAALAVLLLGGLLLSPKYSVSRSVTVNAPADKIYALVADPRRWKEWSAWNRRDPLMTITYSGAPSGSGAVWAWKSKSQGDGRMTFTTAEPGKKLGYELYLPDFGTTSAGVLAMEPAGTGTRLNWVMHGDMGSNPIYRWLALLMDSMVGKDFEAGLANLKTLAETR